ELPAIIAENPGKSFGKAAIFVSRVPMQDNAEDKTMTQPVTLVAFSLTEAPDSEVPVTSVSLNKTTTTIPQYQMETLVASILPADASNKDLSWSSSNDAVASVDDSGNVTAVSEGTATITVTAYGEKTATCEVTVSAPASYDWLMVPTIIREGNTIRVVGPGAEKFTKIYVNGVE